MAMQNIDDFFNAFEDSVDFDFNLGVRFFLCFARFEYALKMSGYLREGRNAQPDWERFAQYIEPEMRQRRENIIESLEYFRDHPTRKQIHNVGILLFEDTPYVDTTIPFIWAMRMIRRVRNNFFHGGKYRDLVVEDSLRNTDLLNHSLNILNECLEIDNDVTTNFKLANG